MPLELDLNKSAAKLQLDLRKKGVLRIPTAEVAYVLDVSGSYDDEHKSGLTTFLMERLTPWAMVLDPDKKMDMFTFSAGDSAHHVGEVTLENYKSFIRTQVIDKVPGYGYGTDYAPVLRMCRAFFGWGPQTSQQAGQPAPRKGGLLGSMFNRNQPAPAQTAAPSGPPPEKRRSLIIFNTDGNNSDRDKAPAEAAIKEMEEAGDAVYVMFLAVANGMDVRKSDKELFPFLYEMADRYSNCGLVVVRDPKEWVQLDDEKINAELITPELLTWLKD